MRAKITLTASEAVLEEYRDAIEEAHFEMPLRHGPWVQFTYGMFRDQDGDFHDLTFDESNGRWWHDGKPFSDLIIEIEDADD